MKKRSGNAKNQKRKARNMAQEDLVKILRVPYSGVLPYADYNLNSSVTSTVGSIYPLDALLGSAGILQQFPAHSTPVFQNGVYRLRQRIIIRRVEMRLVFIGAVSNAVLAADLYNTVRISMGLSGINYSVTSVPYLNGTTAGTNLVNTKRVFFDHTVSLPSQAYDSSITTPTPQVRNWEIYFEPNLRFDTFSTNASGSGAAWDTDGFDLPVDYVSDSSVSPHPTISGTIRFIYDYVR